MSPDLLGGRTIELTIANSAVSRGCTTLNVALRIVLTDLGVAARTITLSGLRARRAFLKSYGNYERGSAGPIGSLAILGYSCHGSKSGREQRVALRSGRPLT